MGAHPNAFDRLSNQLKSARKNPDRVDELLDKWIEFSTLATDWDARQWGFDPDRWMLRERNLITKRAGLVPESSRKAANT